MLLYLNSSPTDMQDGFISIKKGWAIKTVGHQMKELNLITNKRFFTYLAVLKNEKVIIGKYKISKGMTSHEILKRLSNGEILRVGSKITWHSFSKMSGLYGAFAESLCQVIFVRSLRRKVTIPEGFNLYKIAKTLETNNICTSSDFLFFSFDVGFLNSIGISQFC